MNIRIAGFAEDSIVDGPGIRFTIFTQGCPHGCAGCHNPESHDFNGGTVETIEGIIKRFTQNPLLDGITLSGGEPFIQAAACYELAKAAHQNNLSVYTYTGYQIETLLTMAKQNQSIKKLLIETDILIDGQFELDKRSLNLEFRGSTNQRMIDMRDMTFD